MSDLTGKIFGKWTVITISHRIGKRILWSCKCKCGNDGIVGGSDLRGNKSTQCRRCSSTKHGMHKTKTYQAWHDMLYRCNNKNCKSYKHYGGRGILVANEWHDFKLFFASMGEAPPGLEIDRIDVNGNYEPGNCRWTTKSVNLRNRRKKLGTSSNFVGVYWNKSTCKWVAQIRNKSFVRYLGSFDSEKSAHEAYEAAKLKIEGEVMNEQ